MASSPVNTAHRVKERKRHYSKNGCRECKRRKIKCDEAKPSCWQCERLKKSCSYPDVGEKVLRVARRLTSRSSSSPRSEITPQPVSSHNFNSEMSARFTNPNPDSGGSNAPNGHQQYPLNQNLHQNKVHSHLQMPKDYAQQPHVPIPQPPHQQHFAPPQQHQHSLPPQHQQQHGMPIGLPPQHYPQYGMPQHRYIPSSISNLLNDSSNGISSSDHSSSYTSKGNTSPGSSLSQDSPVMFTTPGLHLSKPDEGHLGVSDFSQSDNMMILDNYQYFNQDDLNLLASDLNNIVSNIMFESNYEGKFDVESFKSDIKEDVSLRNSSTIQPDLNSKNIAFDYIQLSSPHEKLYLEEFYAHFAHIILPFCSWEENTQTYVNPARDILLQRAAKEPSLLAAILAQGAKSSFVKNGHEADEEAYCNYLSKCLKLLGPALENGDGKEKVDLRSNIEAVLLTVLLLTSANASNSKQDWRPHLRGAKDLLIKYTSNNRKWRNSKILVFCKYWFVSFEVLAGISSSKGGTLKTNAEIDSLMNPGNRYEIQVMKDLGFIKENGFNILYGYHNSCVAHLRDLVKILNKFRQNETVDAFEIFRVLAELYKQTEIEFINKSGIISPSDLRPGQPTTGHLLERVFVNKQEKVLSWMDICHQAYVLGGVLTLLTKGLNSPYDSPTVQQITSILVSFVEVLVTVPERPAALKCAGMMIQWPSLVAAKNCKGEDQRFTIMKFFKNSSQNGSGGAQIALRRTKKIWNQRDNGEPIDGSDDAEFVSY
ncbi:Lysine biosynthesis regulatory protein LYS14 [Meyerozyma sp. JA9]|nr:Lysine biosynthesis regulatory protein LYS14 [Meyerozyma sp. JA9]